MGSLRHGFDAGLVANVQLQRERTAAKGLDLFDEGLKVVLSAAREDEVRTSPCERAGKISAETAAGPGYECDLAGEIKEWSTH